MLELFFPSRCFHCGLKKNSRSNPNGFLCHSCLNQIKLNQWLFCPNCQKKIPIGRQNCPKHPSALSCLGVAGSYAHPLLKQAIWKYKYEFVEELSWPLAELLFNYFQQTFAPQLKPTPEDWLISFIPLTRKRERWRGFNQAEILALRLSHKTGFSLVRTLIRANFKKPQVEIRKKADRFANVQSCFSVINPEKFKDKKIILIDDISTSGATLTEAAKTLKQGGAQKVFGLVLAKNL